MKLKTLARLLVGVVVLGTSVQSVASFKHWPGVQPFGSWSQMHLGEDWGDGSHHSKSRWVGEFEMFLQSVDRSGSSQEFNRKFSLELLCYPEIEKEPAVSSVPEPGTAALMLLGVLGVVAGRRLKA